MLKTRVYTGINTMLHFMRIVCNINISCIYENCNLKKKAFQKLLFMQNVVSYV